MATKKKAAKKKATKKKAAKKKAAKKKQFFQFKMKLKSSQSGRLFSLGDVYVL